MINHIGRDNYRIKEKWPSFRKKRSNWLYVSCAYIGAYVQRYARCEISMIKTVAKCQLTTPVSSGSRAGALGARAPPSPNFWGPRLYSEAQIAPFYTSITENFQKNFASLRSAYYFNCQLTYFDQKQQKIIHFWGPRLYSEAQIVPFYTQITENFSKKLCIALLGILFQFSIDIF